MTLWVLCDKTVPPRLKEKCYMTTVRPSKLQDRECPTTREHKQDINHRGAYVNMDVQQNFEGQKLEKRE